MTPLATALASALLAAAIGEPLPPEAAQEIESVKRLVAEGRPALAVAKARAAAERAEKSIPWPASGQLEAIAARGCLERAKSIVPALVRSFPDPGPDGLAEARRLAGLAEESFERIRSSARRDGLLPEMGEPSLDPIRISEVRFLSAEAALVAGLALAREDSADKRHPLERALAGFSALAEESAGDPPSAWAAVLQARTLVALGRPAEACEVLDALDSLVPGPAAFQAREALARTLAQVRPAALHVRALAAFGRGVPREGRRLLEAAEAEAGPGAEMDILRLAGLLERARSLADEGCAEEAEAVLETLLGREDAWAEAGRLILATFFPDQRTAREWRAAAKAAEAAGDEAGARRANAEAARKAVEEEDGSLLAEFLRPAAERYLEDGLLPEAAAAAWGAWRADPDSAEAEGCLRIALHALVPGHDPEGAIRDPAIRPRILEAAQTLVGRFPSGDAAPEARLLIAFARRADGDLPGALRELQEVPERSGSRGEALFAIAAIRQDTSPARPREALEAYLAVERWAESRPKGDPDRIRRLQGLARARGAFLARSLGRDGDAVRLAETALVADESPEAERRRLRLVVAAGRAALGDADAAAEAARTLMRESPASGEAEEAAFAVAALLDRQLDDLAKPPGDPRARTSDEAFREFIGKAVRRIPAGSQYSLRLRTGDRSLRMGHGDLALQDYRLALAALERESAAVRARESPGLRYRIARASSAVGRPDEAIAILSALARQQPTAEAVWVRRALAEALERKGDYREAARVWRELSLGLESPRDALEPFAAAASSARTALRIPDAAFALESLRSCLEKRGGAPALRRADPAAMAGWIPLLAEIARASPAAAPGAESLRKSLGAP